MKVRSSYVRLLLAVGLSMLMGATGCPWDDGGGGGGGTITFNKGFVFVRDDENVYIVDDADFDTVGQLTTNGGNKHPSLATDGSLAVFVHVSGTTSSIMTVAANGGGSPQTVYTADTAAGQKNFKNPVFSPDGQTIVFAYEVSTTSFLAKVAADGSGFTTLTTGPLSYASPSFYPSGSANDGWVLAAAGNTIGQYTQLDRIRVVGGTVGQLLPVTNSLGSEASAIVNRVVLSSDGLKVAFDGRLTSASSTVRIFVQTLSSGSTLRISDAGAGSSANHAYPTWTSMSDVGFVSDEGGANKIYVQSASATGTGALTVPSGDQPWFGP